MTTRHRFGVVAALGVAQTLAWSSSYYLPAILAGPMAAAFGLSPAAVFGAFSAALLLAAGLAPAVGRAIDRRGGRTVLALSNLVFAAGLAAMAAAPNFPTLCIGWAVLAFAMAAGLYDAAFAALAGIYGREARGPISGITLIAGFASTVGWPVSAVMLDLVGWRGACLGWAALHLVVGLPLNRFLPPAPPPTPTATTIHATTQASRREMALLAFMFAATLTVSTAMATHLPGVLRAADVSASGAVAAAALVGPAQVAARLAEFALLRRLHPLVSARIAAGMHPLAAVLLLAFGAPMAAGFALLHGGGNGVLTIAKGTLPLALFGPGGYGARTGLISIPARIAQAAAPIGFAWAIEAFGACALWITTGLSLAAVASLLALRTDRPA